MLTSKQLQSIQDELRKATGIEFSVWRNYDSYQYGIKIIDDVVVDIIGSTDLEVDRERSFIRIIKDRHPEYFL